ncbi:MAG: hypothetical protein J6A21_07195 [Lentisphaeria bacterium]|nr:hypothetical protein [Lentisphaeria bacterium]
MPMDFSYYYDFSGELSVKEWAKTLLPGGKSLWEGVLVLPEEKGRESSRWVALWPSHIVLSEINGKNVGDVSRSLYIGNRYGRSAFPVTLVPGENLIRVLFTPPPWREEDGEFTFEMGFVPDFDAGNETPSCRKTLERTDPYCVRKGAWKEDLSGTPGAGRKMTPGRFGFAKGDGLLDYGISSFGLVDKMYLCGHPKHPMPYRWGYCVLPGEEKTHFSPEEMEKYGDEIRVNQLSASWRSQKVLLKYSLGSPGLYVFSEEKDVKLSLLEFAGSPQYVMTSDAVTDLKSFSPSSMKENFLLLFGSREFPEVPILVLLEKKPEKLLLTWKGNRISSIAFAGCRRMITATPFGLEVLDPAAPADTEFLKEASRRARFWSRALLAFPKECTDFFHIDEKEQKCRITQKFTYEILTDEWGTLPLRLAPYPPAAVLSGRGEFDPNAADLGFPTKYGPFLAVEGDSSSYTIPLMPDEIRFPLAEEKGKASEILKEGLKEFFDFQEHFPDNFRSYAYIGSSLERWGFAAMLPYFPPEKYRKLLAEKAGKSLEGACDPESTYTCLLTEHSYLWRMEEHPHKTILDYYYGPRMLRKEMKNFYCRREPFTGVKYVICYLNVGWVRQNRFLTDREISESPVPYYENDWGLGVSFYTLYTCALASGDFGPVRKHWDALKKMYEYLDLYHDWACMSAGYSERGTVWCEGANYGAYTAFPRLAKIAGDEEAYKYGRYLAAKELALRMAVYRSSQNYFCKCYKVPPFGITKAFREEEGPFLQFQGVPKELDRNRLRPGQLHTYITEGAFPELLRHYRKLLPEEHRKIMELYLDQMLDPERERNGYFWGRQLTPTMILLDLADDPSYPAEKLLENFSRAEKMDSLIRQCRDIGTFSTFHPEKLYPAMIFALLEARRHPVLLEHWEDMQIGEAFWQEEKKRARIRYVLTGGAPLLVCRLKNGAKVRKSSLAGEEKDGKILFRPKEKQGIIEIEF